jgi:hypothetical protein
VTVSLVLVYVAIKGHGKSLQQKSTVLPNYKKREETGLKERKTSKDR